MQRLAWLLAAACLLLAGFDLLQRGWLGGAGYLVTGVGIGILTSVLGSYAHDLLAGRRERL